MTATDTHSDELICFSIYSLDRAFGRYYKCMFSKTGLTYPKFVILRVLCKNGAMSVSELSAKAGVEQNSLSPLIKKMSGAGIIHRQRSEQDERKVEVSLTPLGEAVYERALKVVEAGFERFQHSDAEAANIIQTLKTLKKKLETINPPILDMGLEDIIKDINDPDQS